MTIRCVERDSGERKDILPGKSVIPKGNVSFGKDKLYNYLSLPISLVSLPKGQGYLVDFGEKSPLNFCVWPGSSGYIQTETTIFTVT